MDEPAWGLRCYLKAREIREERLGGDTVDTATVYNNLGCCMYMLERNQECLAYFELSHAILECELGPSHERTMTVITSPISILLGPTEYNEVEADSVQRKAPVQTTMDDSSTPSSPKD